jgi:sulfopropanediol 3-dehydrogenase
VPEFLKQPAPVTDDVAVDVRSVVAEILAAVRNEGVEGIRRYSRRFDDWSPESFRVAQGDIDRAAQEIDGELRGHIDFAIEQVRAFARLQRATLTEFEEETLPGVWLGQKHIPIAAVGAYSPGGRYALIASSIMSVAVPKVAGVERVVAVAPPRPGGGIHPAQLYAMSASGADEILCLGGVQALGALAYGFDGFEPVDFIVGAGNQYVTEAKRQLFGPIGIDLLAGPSERLATTSRELGTAVLEEIDRSMAAWPTAQIAGEAWADHGAVVVCEDDEELLRVADEYAAEHVEVHTREPLWFRDRLRNYGSLFLTPHTTVAYGDKAIGTNHVLPTGRASRYTGGLWVGKFVKTVTYQRATVEGSRLVAPSVAAICDAEEMRGHAITARYRLNPEATRAEVLGDNAAGGRAAAPRPAVRS